MTAFFKFNVNKMQLISAGGENLNLPHIQIVSATTERLKGNSHAIGNQLLPNV
jgi:hypothetical protein